MTQQIIDVGANANDGTGEPLREAFTAVNDNFTQIWTAGPVGSQVQITGNIISTTVTNLGLTLAGNGIGNIQANSTVVPGTSGVYDLGAPDRTFQYIYGDYLVGNGALITGIVANTSYNNSNVAAFLPTYTGNLVSLTGPVITTANVIAGNLITSGFLGVTGNITSVANITGNNLISSGYVSAVGNINTTANISGNYLLGNGAFITGITATNIAAGALTGTTLSSNVLYSSLKVVDDLLYLDVVGNVTTQGRFIGSGAGLTNIPGANVTGTVAAASTAITAGTVTTAAQPNITSVGTLTSLTATGNVTANYFIGNGSQLTNVIASSVGANALTGSTLSANVLNSTLVSVGNLNNLSVIGNAVGGNFLTAGIVSATGNITTANYFVGNGRQLTGIQASEVGVLANLSVTGNTVTGNLLTGGMVSAVGNIKTTANVTGNYFIGNGSQLTGIIASAGAAITNGNSNVTVNANGNVTVGVVGTSNVTVFANTGAYVTGEVSATGNVTGNYLLGNGALITGLPAGYSNADVANYLPTYTGNLVSLTGPVTTTSNITGGNVLTGGLISATGNVTGNYILGNGALLTGVITSVANINNGTSNVTVVSSSGNVTVGVGGTANVAVFATTGEYITGELSANGNVTGGNLLTSGLVSAISNITGGNLLTQGLVSATGTITSSANITGGNVLTDGLVSAAGTVTGSSLLASVVSASGDVTGGNVLTGGLVSATANVTGGNLLTAGQLSAAGNITGNYILGNGSQLTGVAASSVYANALIGNTLSSNVLYSSLTQVGTLANLSVTANVTGGNVLTGGIISATANVIGGNISTGGVVTATGEIISAANITGANLVTAGLATVSGNITGGNLLTGGVVSATANITGGNLLTTGLISATSTITSASNITGGNLLTTGLISATSTITSAANITGGNVLTAGLISATGNVIGGNVNTSNIQPVSGALTISTASGNLNLQPAGNVVLANTIITGVAYPQQDTDAATKLYVDNFATTAITYHQPVAAATTTTLAVVTGGTITYTQPNGVANGIGALLTTTGSFDLIDTANVQTVGTRILVKNEGNAVFNGVYTWANATNIIRSTDADQYGSSSTEELSINDYFFIQGGSVNKGSAYVVSAPAGTITFGTSNITFSEFSSSQTYTANTSAGLSLTGTVFSAKVDNDTTAFDGGGNIMVKAGANLTTPNIGAATGTSISLTGNVTGGNITTGGLVSATANVIGGNLVTAGLATVSGNITGGNVLTGGVVSATANITGGNVLTAGLISATGTITSADSVTGGNLVTAGLVSATGNVTGGNVLTAGLISATGNVTGSYILGNISQATGILGNTINMGTNTAGSLVSNAVTLTTSTTVTNGIALLNQVLGKLVPPAPSNFPNATSITLTGIASYRMANITQVDNTPGANKAVAAGTTVANVLRVATYATNTIANVGPGDAGTITAVRNGANVGSVTLNAGASPSGNGTYGSNLVISNNFDYNSANSSIAAGFWYVFSSRVSGASAPPGWNELYIADSSTANTNTTVWYYDASSPSTPAFSSTTMTPPGSANLLYSSTIPHYTNNNNFTIAFTVANISGNTYPTSNTLASGSSGGAFAAPVTINYNGSNIGSNVLNSFASATANTTASVTTGFGGSSTGPSMSVNNSYSTGTLTLTSALANTVLWKSGTATAIEESNVVINTTIGTGSGNAYRIVNPGTGNTPVYTGSEAAFNSQSSTLQTYDATVVGSGSSGVLKHDQTNYATGYLPAGPNLSSGRTGTQYFTMKFVRTAVSKFDIKYTGNIAGMWVALPGSVIDSSSSANGWINMAVAYGGAGYPGVNAPGNGSDGCATGGVVTLNTSVTNSSKTCTFGTVSSSSTATNEIYVRIALTSGQSVTALTLETASN